MCTYTFVFAFVRRLRALPLEVSNITNLKDHALY